LEEPQIANYLDQVVKALRERNLKARAIVAGSGPARTIAEVSASEDCDMVLLAKNGRGGSHRRAALGSVAIRLVQTVQCPILLVDKFGNV
jgi:nucleotide-binding universal stress UspA family protein